MMYVLMPIYVFSLFACEIVDVRMFSIVVQLKPVWDCYESESLTHFLHIYIIIFIIIYIIYLIIYIYIFDYIYMIIYIYISYQNGMYIWLQFTAPSSVHCFHEESILSGIVAYVTARIYLLIYKITDRIYIYI